uniref:Uncharacterized protein n=1 Tax=Anguilla anguilla TaxID=7936 RepID=A0A0E9XXF8_ANGAN
MQGEGEKSPSGIDFRILDNLHTRA